MFVITQHQILTPLKLNLIRFLFLLNNKLNISFELIIGLDNNKINLKTKNYKLIQENKTIITKIFPGYNINFFLMYFIY